MWRCVGGFRHNGHRSALLAVAYLSTGGHSLRIRSLCTRRHDESFRSQTILHWRTAATAWACSLPAGRRLSTIAGDFRQPPLHRTALLWQLRCTAARVDCRPRKPPRRKPSRCRLAHIRARRNRPAAVANAVMTTVSTHTVGARRWLTSVRWAISATAGRHVVRNARRRHWQRQGKHAGRHRLRRDGTTRKSEGRAKSADSRPKQQQERHQRSPGKGVAPHLCELRRADADRFDRGWAPIPGVHRGVKSLRDNH